MLETKYAVIYFNAEINQTLPRILNLRLYDTKSEALNAMDENVHNYYKMREHTVAKYCDTHATVEQLCPNGNNRVLCYWNIEVVQV